jgi:hypothetical protein
VIGGTSFGIDVTGTLGPAAQITVSNCQPPTVKAIGPRYLSVTPATGPASVAFKVTGVEADVACVTGWVQASGIVSTTPVYQSPATWGSSFSVRGASLFGDRTYQVQADCEPSNPGTGLSSPVSAKLFRWGNLNNDGVIDVRDIVLSIDAFRNDLDLTNICSTDADCAGVAQAAPHFKCHIATGRCYKVLRESADLVGLPASVCLPETAIDIRDIVGVVDARPIPCVPSCP